MAGVRRGVDSENLLHGLFEDLAERKALLTVCKVTPCRRSVLSFGESDGERFERGSRGQDGAKDVDERRRRVGFGVASGGVLGIFDKAAVRRVDGSSKFEEEVKVEVD